MKGVLGVTKICFNAKPEGQINARLETVFPVSWLDSPSSDFHHELYFKRYAPAGLDPATQRLTNRQWLLKKFLVMHKALPVQPFFAMKAQLDACKHHGLTPQQIETLKNARFVAWS
jgi:hypothetical protein